MEVYDINSQGHKLVLKDLQLKYVSLRSKLNASMLYTTLYLQFQRVQQGAIR